MYILNNYAITSARPEVRGTADVGWRSLNPLPINPPRTHSRLYHHMCLRTDGRWRTWMEYLISVSSWRGRCVAHHFNAVCGDGGGVCVGHVRPPHSAPNTNYHLLGWWSTVQTSAHERRKGTLIVRWRSDILAHLCPRQHWSSPTLPARANEEAVARKGVAVSAGGHDLKIQ